MIKIENLYIKYPKNDSILEDVNIVLKEGNRISIVGENGVGKTSFVETLIGLNKNFTGNIFIDKNIKNSIRNVFQEVNYDKELTLKFMYLNYGKLAGLKNSELDLNCFKEYNLFHLKNKLYSNLSGGEKQKFKLLMALNSKPKVLIIDEVTTSLDYIWKNQIIKIIKDYLLKNPLTILIVVSHDLKEIQSLTDDVYLIKNKNFIKIDNVSNYFENLYGEEKL